MWTYTHSGSLMFVAVSSTTLFCKFLTFRPWFYFFFLYLYLPFFITHLHHSYFLSQFWSISLIPLCYHLALPCFLLPFNFPLFHSGLLCLLSLTPICLTLYGFVTFSPLSLSHLCHFYNIPVFYFTPLISPWNIFLYFIFIFPHCYHLSQSTDSTTSPHIFLSFPIFLISLFPVPQIITPYSSSVPCSPSFTPVLLPLSSLLSFWQGCCSCGCEPTRCGHRPVLQQWLVRWDSPL